MNIYLLLPHLIIQSTIILSGIILSCLGWSYNPKKSKAVFIQFNLSHKQSDHLLQTVLFISLCCIHYYLHNVYWMCCIDYLESTYTSIAYSYVYSMWIAEFWIIKQDTHQVIWSKIDCTCPYNNERTLLYKINLHLNWECNLNVYDVEATRSDHREVVQYNTCVQSSDRPAIACQSFSRKNTTQQGR